MFGDLRLEGGGEGGGEGGEEGRGKGRFQSRLFLFSSLRLDEIKRLRRRSVNERCARGQRREGKRGERGGLCERLEEGETRARSRADAISC